MAKEQTYVEKKSGQQRTRLSNQTWHTTAAHAVKTLADGIGFDSGVESLASYVTVHRAAMADVTETLEKAGLV